MYLSTITSPAEGDDALEPGHHRWALLGGNVAALGTVSLITDVSSEMVTAVLPLYLMAGLHLGPAVYGIIDGLYGGATVLLRLAGGYISDRIQRHKTVAGFGYGVSAAAKLGLLVAGSSPFTIGLVITADRAGKGLRSAPRDALISLSSPPEQLGRAFGLHRAMDAVGAFAGPLVSLVVLAVAGHAYDAVFVTSFCVSVLGVLVLMLFVRDYRVRKTPSERHTVRAAVGLLRGSAVRRLVLTAVLLGLATIGDGFVFLLLQQREGITLGWFPLLAVGTSLAYLLLAAPMGALADRIGRMPVMLGGYGALGSTYLLLYGPLSGVPLAVTVVALYGLFYAATDGVLMALVGPLVPERLRATGMALVQSGQAVAYLGSSVLFGLAWQSLGAEAASRLSALAVLLAMGATALLLSVGTARSGTDSVENL